MSEKNGGTSEPAPDALQARIDLHQNILREYRVRGYQMVLVHTGLAIAAGKYAIDRDWGERLAVGIAMVLVTLFLRVWLGRLREKSDGHRDDAMVLYRRLGVGLERDAPHSQSRPRLWGPLVNFPWASLAGLCVWLLGPNLVRWCATWWSASP